jgi:hypothetical protein
MDRFHDKRRRLYDRDVQRDDQKVLDELALRPNTAPSAMRAYQSA